MVEHKISLNDLYNKVGILFFTTTFFLGGIFLNQVENQIAKNIMYVLFILSYFGFIILFGFFFDYFIKKALDSSKNILTKLINKVDNFLTKYPSLSKSISYLVIATPLIGVIFYIKGVDGLIEVLIYPIVGFLLLKAHQYYIKHKEKK